MKEINRFEVNRFAYNIAGCLLQYSDLRGAEKWFDGAESILNTEDMRFLVSEVTQRLLYCSQSDSRDSLDRLFAVSDNKHITALKTEFREQVQVAEKKRIEREKEEARKKREQEEKRIKQERIEAEKKRIEREREEARRKREQEEAERIKRWRIEAEKRAKEEVERREQKRIERENAIATLKECFESKSEFLSADDLYNQRFSDVLSVNDYQQEKVKFIKQWADKNGILLDDEQSAAVAQVNGHVQVVARAGSGKTRTLVNRAIFLQEYCDVSPGQIILLAFNKKAADEIEERLEKHFDDRGIPHVMTFHALAYAMVHPERLLVDDKGNGYLAKSRVLQTVIDEHIQNLEFFDRIRDLMLKHFRHDWERIVQGFKGFLEYRHSLPRVTLGGEYVKSYGEKLIADFLFEHQLDYVYEKSHWWDDINYRPDFTVYRSADSGIIVEYFGMAGEDDYDDQIEDKRRHLRNKPDWTLLEIRPEDVATGREQAFESLKKLFEGQGVPCVRLGDNEIWEKMNKENRIVDSFTETVVNFIQRCRKLSISPDQLDGRVGAMDSLNDIQKEFVRLTKSFYQSYLDRLDATGEDDFDGLMHKSIGLINGGKMAFERKSGNGDLRNIRYMFIDEYQDFSHILFQLVGAIKDQNSNIQFFCVGDDWQAIYGFAGSDLQYYKDFHQSFAPSVKLGISTNYRSAKSIVEVANSLMKGEGNPAIPHKTESGTVLLADIETFQPEDRELERHSGNVVYPVLIRLISKSLSVGGNVVLISKTNSIKGREIEKLLSEVRSFFPDEGNRITVSTVHKYKGLERDTVILLDVVARNYPLIHPNWVFTQVLGDTLEKIVAEEKRLFYVALTRAVDSLFILTEGLKMSPFLKDIISRQDVETINWDDFPAMKDSHDRVTVQVVAGPGTFNIKDYLKACGYRWKPKPQKCWQKSYSHEGFDISKVQRELWSSEADGVTIRVADSSGSLMGKYAVKAGKWERL